MTTERDIDGELPEGWRMVRLGDVATEVRNGIATKPDAEQGTPILRISAVRPMSFNSKDVRYLTGSRAQWDQYRLRMDDLLFTRYNGNPELVGVCARVQDEPVTPLVYPDKLIRVRTSADVALPAFIERAVHVGASREFIAEKTKTSAGQVGISGGDLKLVPLPLPPLPEQRRIVAKLESLQSRSRRAREALEAVPPLLEKLRQSILAAAFRGDLTADWREQHPDVEPASELLKRIRIERRKKWEQAELAKLKAKGKKPTDDKWKQKYVEPEPVDDSELPELPEGWVWASLDELTESSFYGPRIAATDYCDDGVRTIRTTDMDDTGRIRWRDPPCVKLTDVALEELRCHDGDLLVTRTGSIGKCAVYDSSLGPAIPSAYLIRFRPLLSVVSPRILFRQLQAPGLQSLLGLGTTATTQPNINARTLGRMPFAICGLDEQRDLQRRLESQLESADGARTSGEGLRSGLISLDSSLLSKAFRGELVPQDPKDLISTPPDAQTTKAVHAPVKTKRIGNLSSRSSK
jgi:type I restriction enzyme, S subunit